MGDVKCAWAYLRKAKVEGNRGFHVPSRGSIIINTVTRNMRDREISAVRKRSFPWNYFSPLAKKMINKTINKQYNPISSINPHNSLCLPSEL